MEDNMKEFVAFSRKLLRVLINRRLFLFLYQMGGLL